MTPEMFFTVTRTTADGTASDVRSRIDSLEDLIELLGAEDESVTITRRGA